MINGLYDLNVLGLGNRELLRKIGFDFTLLDLAAQKSNDLATKKEAASFDSEDYLEAKNICDQAYTHLKEAVDYIREYAKYVFWRNPSSLKKGTGVIIYEIANGEEQGRRRLLYLELKPELNH